MLFMQYLAVVMLSSTVAQNVDVDHLADHLDHMLGICWGKGGGGKGEAGITGTTGSIYNPSRHGGHQGGGLQIYTH